MCLRGPQTTALDHFFSLILQLKASHGLDHSQLELTPEKQAAAEKRYKELGRHVARHLGVGETDVHVVVQGSMKTQTTIAGDGREKFDLDIVVKLCGTKSLSVNR